MNSWTPKKPKLNREVILLTASKYKDHWIYHSWLIQKVDNDDGGWYWGWCTLDGEEWDDINDLQADLYKIINIPNIKIKP